MQVLRNRLQVQVLDTPDLQPRLLPRVPKLLMGHHVGSVRRREGQGGEIWRHGRSEGHAKRSRDGFEYIQNVAANLLNPNSE